MKKLINQKSLPIIFSNREDDREGFFNSQKNWHYLNSNKACNQSDASDGFRNLISKLYHNTTRRYPLEYAITRICDTNKWSRIDPSNFLGYIPHKNGAICGL